MAETGRDDFRLKNIFQGQKQPFLLRILTSSKFHKMLQIAIFLAINLRQQIWGKFMGTGLGSYSSVGSCFGQGPII